MGYWGKKISFYTFLLYRIAIFIMAVAIAYLCIFGGVTLKMIKLPLIGGEIQFEEREELPKGTVKISLNQAKYIFDNHFILKVRSSERGSQTAASFHVNFYKITSPVQEFPRNLAKSKQFMMPGDILSISLDDLWYHVRMLQIKYEGENAFCYFHLYTEEAHKKEG